MTLIVGNEDFSTHLDGGLFLLFKSSTKHLAYYFSAGEIDLLKLEKLIPGPGFQCKAIGPKDIEPSLSIYLKKLGVELDKFIARDSGELRFFGKTQKIMLEKASPEAKKIRVAIVDDSKTIRHLLRKILSADSGIEVIADFESPMTALEQIPKIKPDVITLDIHMPEMDGIQFLKKIMPICPIPTVMISSLSMEEGPLVLNAMEAGAVDYLQKPSFDQLATASPVILEKIIMAAAVQLPIKVTAKVSAKQYFGTVDKTRLIAIGSSTGGTEALREVLTRLPAEIPPIVIVQHIPAVFSKAFADRMSSLCKFLVKEAEHNEEVKSNTCYVAPGGLQMKLKSEKNGAITICLEDGPPINRHKPSVDYLFQSVATLYGKKAIGAILTGMGADGAAGLLEMKKKGALTFGQNEATCVVYGMPQAAKKIGAVDHELPLLDIPDAILSEVYKKRAAS